jgi:pre-mRNA-processing factor 40
MYSHSHLHSQHEVRAARSRAISKVVSLFKVLDVDVLTRWRKAHEMVTESSEWRADPELRKLPTLDILLAFEDYSRVKEREFEEQMRRAQVEKTREERKAREAFRAVLQELMAAGKIKARSKWRHVYPSFASDQRYLNLLGKPGSNPLELFWDAVDALDQKLEAKIAIAEECARRGDDPNVMDVVKGDNEKELPSVVSVQTTFEEFKARVRRDPDSVGKLREDDLREVYDTVCCIFTWICREG